MKITIHLVVENYLYWLTTLKDLTSETICLRWRISILVQYIFISQKTTCQFGFNAFIFISIR